MYIRLSCRNQTLHNLIMSTMTCHLKRNISLLHNTSVHITSAQWTSVPYRTVLANRKASHPWAGLKNIFATCSVVLFRPHLVYAVGHLAVGVTPNSNCGSLACSAHLFNSSCIPATSGQAHLPLMHKLSLTQPMCQRCFSCCH